MYRALRIAPSRRACSAHSVGRNVQRISQFSISERYALGWLIGAKHTGSQPQAQYLRLTLIGLAPWETRRWQASPGRGERIQSRQTIEAGFLSPLRGSFACPPVSPALTRWARFCRPAERGSRGEKCGLGSRAAMGLLLGRQFRGDDLHEFLLGDLAERRKRELGYE